ncbi:hypothetical protein [Streptomyces sp. NPDC005283]|uniref:hypothetical protein n=1 Tax=Streptomyces sp. NPDC005283 TaxID=3156871 RepID=UPI0034563DAF
MTLPGSGAKKELYLIGCYHPSRRTTSTARITLPTLVDVFRRASAVSGLDQRAPYA